MKNRLLITLLILLNLLSTAPPAQAAQAIPADPAAPAGLLEFTSGGHVVGFAAGGVYAAAGDHALHVAFMDANAVRPQSDSPSGRDGEAATLGRVVYENLWDGITLAYSSGGGSIYTSAYTLAPGADPAAIRLEYNAPVSLNEDGSLAIAFDTGALTESAPIAWQEIGGRRVPVDASFDVRGQEVTFALGAYDPRNGLTIDPALVWNTFLGGSMVDTGQAIAVDMSGNIYVVGYSGDGWGTPVESYSGSDDAFAAKLSPSGALLWNTFVGGDSTERGEGVAVDGSGNVLLAGSSNATWGTPVRAYGGGDNDAFVAKLDPSGELTWHTFLGGDSDDFGHAVAVDGSGNAYAAGDSFHSWGSPTRSHSGLYDAFAAKLTPYGALSWNAFLGGSSVDAGNGIAVDGSGNVYLAGQSFSSWGSPLRAYTGAYDAFAAKLTPSGALSWNTFLGGSGDDLGFAVAVDSDRNVYLAGESSATWGSPVRAFTDVFDAFAVKLNPSGALSWNTFLGGSETDNGYAVAVDRGGNVYIAGESDATWGAPWRPHAGGYDAFAAKLGPTGALTANIFLGAAGADAGYAIAVDGSGTYVTGISESTWGGPVRVFASNYDAFAARVNLPHTCPLEGQEVYDFTGDCRTDVAVYRPSTGRWYIRNQYSTYYGAPGDIPVPGDYNGDGTTDIAVYRPSTGAWYVRNQFTAYFGAPGDLPVPGDYNGDDTTEIAVYRPSTGAWYVRGMSTVYYGVSTDIPVPGDYTGSGMRTIAVYRPATGAWYIRGQAKTYYGTSTDIPVPGDYDGSGISDIAVYRPSTGAWYIRGQATVYYGASDDIPVPGDYDGDGDTDIAVFRPSNGAWYIRGQYSAYYGSSGDIPLPEMGTGKAGSAP